MLGPVRMGAVRGGMETREVVGIVAVDVCVYFAMEGFRIRIWRRVGRYVTKYISRIYLQYYDIRIYILFPGFNTFSFYNCIQYF